MSTRPVYAPASLPSGATRATRFGARTVSRIRSAVPRNMRSDRAMSGYAKYAVATGTILTLMISVRLTEIIPGAELLRPVILTAVLCGYYLFRKTRMDVLQATLRDPVVVALLAYASIGVIGVPFALMGSQALKMLPAFVFGIILTVAVMMIPPTIKALERFTWQTVAGAMLVSMNWLVVGRTKARGRLTSSGSYDPNDLAAMMCLFLPMALGMVVRGAWWHRLLGAGSAVVFMMMIVLTSSRGGMVAFIVIMVTFLFIMRPSRAVVAVIVAVPMLIGGWALAPDQFKTRAASLGNVEQDYNMTLQTGRIAIWKRGWGHFLSAPLTGVGMGNYQVAEGNFFSSTNTVAAFFTAHNTYIQAFVEFGFFGGCALMFMVISSIYGTWRAARPMYKGIPNPLYRPEYLAALMGYYAAAFFLSHAFTYLLFGAIGTGMFVRNVQRAMAAQAGIR